MLKEHSDIVLGSAEQNRLFFCIIWRPSCRNKKYWIAVANPHLISTVVVSSLESNTFSMSASFAFSWLHGCWPRRTQIASRHTCNANTEQVLHHKWDLYNYVYFDKSIHCMSLGKWVYSWILQHSSLWRDAT